MRPEDYSTDHRPPPKNLLHIRRPDASSAARHESLEAALAETFGRELEAARAAGDLAFYARLLAQVTLPHSRVTVNEYERVNGDLTLTLLAPSKIGLPYGTIPRLTLFWVCTEAFRTRSRDLVLGDCLADFMAELDVEQTGGRKGTIRPWRRQLTSLFATAFTVHYTGDGFTHLAGVHVADEALILWDPSSPNQRQLWQSTVCLSERFYQAVVDRPFPVSMAALRWLRKSPLALDLYTWLTYRLSYLDRRTPIPLAALAVQFGSNYAELKHFRWKLEKALAKLRAIWPELRVELDSAALILQPGRPHVLPRGDRMP
jgi:hypothetical protein